MHKEKQQQSEAETGERRKRESGEGEQRAVITILGHCCCCFFSLLWQKNTKKYMKLSRSKFPRIIYVRKDKNKKHNVETSVKVAQREAPN